MCFGSCRSSNMKGQPPAIRPLQGAREDSLSNTFESLRLQSPKTESTRPTVSVHPVKEEPGLTPQSLSSIRHVKQEPSLSTQISSRIAPYLAQQVIAPPNTAAAAPPPPPPQSLPAAAATTAGFRTGGWVPIFPQHPPPLCRYCGSVSKQYTTRDANPNGNAGRPYYVCDPCKSRESPSKYNSGWVAWDDNIGIDRNNPACDCGYLCRRGQAGRDARRYAPGHGFWTCAVGGCGYVSFRRDGLTDEEASTLGLADDGEFWS